MIKNLQTEKISTEDNYIRSHLKAVKFIEMNSLEKAQKLIESLLKANYKPRVYEILTLNNLALVYMRQKLYNKAMLTLIKALIKCKTINSPNNLIGTLLNLSAAASSLKIHSEALSYSLQALSVAQDVKDQSLIKICQYNIGIEYINLSKYPEAEQILKKTFRLVRQTQSDPRLLELICKALSSIGSGLKKIEKGPKPVRNEPKFSSRAMNSTGRKYSKGGSNTSSSESIKTPSKVLRKSIGSYKHLKIVSSSKSSQKSTPLSNTSFLQAYLPENELGNRIHNIGDHLNNIEKKLNDFVELFKPLKILTEDPDEQLDSYRLSKYNLKAIIRIQRIAKKNFHIKNLSAIIIQRAYRRYKTSKKLKSLLKFKDNPLFKQSALLKPSFSTQNMYRKTNSLNN